jgi:hypothetical protein
MRRVDPAKVKQALELVLGSIPDPRGGLPDSVFEFLLKVTTIINVDLLIRDIRGTLLVWREDDLAPGGISPAVSYDFMNPSFTAYRKLRDLNSVQQ